MRLQGWRRQLWGVKFWSARCDDTPLLLGTRWDHSRPSDYPGEPTRPLLFVTRATARAWASTKQAQYSSRTDSCAAWRFRAVRVIETVRPSEPKATA